MRLCLHAGRRAVPPPQRASATSGDWLAEVSALSDRAARALEASASRAQAASSRAAEASSRDASSDPRTSLRMRLESAAAAMQAGLVERDAEVRLMLLAALGREHVLLVGPPGTAKSELGRRLSRLCAGPFFERMLTKFSVPEELFGPLSLQALERDEYVRRTEGYLPCAHVAFVDEIFKASSSILNTLLGMLHERAFDNGRGATRVPLVCLVRVSQAGLCSRRDGGLKRALSRRLPSSPPSLDDDRWRLPTSFRRRRSWRPSTTASSCGVAWSR